MTADLPIPLLRLITRLNIGGPARQALLLTRALRPQFETVLATGRPAASEGSLSDPEVEPVEISLVRPPSPIDDARALAAVRGLIADIGPAIVHTHMAKAGTLGRVAALTSRRRPLLVHTFHGHVLEGYFRPAVARTYLTVERALAKRTDALVAVSEQTRDDLLELGIGEPAKWRVVPLGLDLDAHLSSTGRSGAIRSRFGVGDDVVLAGMVGRLVPIKAPELALRALARVPDLHLAIVGDGELRGSVEAQAAALGVADRTHFTGWMSDVPAVMADLDFAVLSSRNEGTPVALIEAAACGRPAVATDVGGVRSVVVDGHTGLVVPPDDEAALAGAMARLASDTELRTALGSAARERAPRWSAARLVADIDALYRELLNGR